MAVREAVAYGRLKGHETLRAQTTIRVAGLNLTLDGEDNIELECVNHDASTIFCGSPSDPDAGAVVACCCLGAAAVGPAR